MSNEQETKSAWIGLIPKSRPAIIGVVIVAVLAFFLGGLFTGGGDSPTSESPGDGHDHTEAAADEPTVWTCSMHPQIQLPKPGKCPICYMDLIPVETGSGGDELDPNQIRMSETAKRLARIETSPVTRAFAEREIRMVGKIDYDETKLSYITAWVPGRLDRLFVDFTGARVAKGEHLVEMYSPELISAQEELLQAIKAVDALDNASSSILQSTAKETVRSAREKLRLYGLSESQIDSVKRAGRPSDHLTITAPIGGIVIHKDAREGMYVSTGTKIYTIADLSKLWVILQAYESDLPWLSYGQHVSFTSPSFPGEKFDAIISFIDPVVDPKTRTVQVRAIVENSNGGLKPEMLVSGIVSSRLDNEGRVIEPSLAGKWICPMHPEIVKDHPGKCDICGMDLVKAESLGFSTATVNEDDAPLLIPASAPLITGKRAIVYVEIPNDEGPLFEGREIALGPRADDHYVVKDGLQEGELVVTNGAFRIDSELQIQAKPSMMSPDEGASIAGHQQSEPETAVKSVAKGETYKAGSAKRLDNCEEVQVALTPVYQAYFDLQMSLADDDLNRAKEAFSNVFDKVEAVDMGLFKGEAHARWMEISEALADACEKGKSSSNIEAARDAFFHASLAAIEMHDTYGHSADAPYYLTFCPMARDNAGAYWLQTVDTVYNSFYGPSMLRCGEIKKTLTGASSVQSSETSGDADLLTPLYHAYFRLQRALTFDDLNQTVEAYQGLAETAEKVGGLESGSFENHVPDLEQQAATGAKSSDLESARAAFLPIASLVVNLHDNYGHTENTDYFLIYCPHAADSGGVSWLQDVDTMYNSFLGGVMPNCTEEKKTLPPLNTESD